MVECFTFFSFSTVSLFGLLFGGVINQSLILFLRCGLDNASSSRSQFPSNLATLLAKFIRGRAFPYWSYWILFILVSLLGQCRRLLVVVVFDLVVN